MKFVNVVISLLLLTEPTTTFAKGGVRSGNLNEEPQQKSHERNLSTLDQPCTAVVGVEDFTDKPSDMFLGCEIANGESYKVTGVDKEWIEDKMKNGLLKSGKTMLNMPGAKINKENGEIRGTSPGLVNKKDNDRNLRELAVTAGTKTVLVVRVIASNAATTKDESVLGASVFEDTVGLKNQVSACSHGKLNFVPASNKDKVAGATSSTDIRYGVTTVTVTESAFKGNDGPMRNEITQELQKQFGVHPTSLANHVMYCLPPNTMNGIAYAYVNHWLSVYSDDWCTYVSGQMHELGHNLNIAHAGEGTLVYEDQSGMMGYSYSQRNGPIMCFNGANFWQFGWFDNVYDQREVNESDLPLDLTLEGFVKPLESTDGLKVVKINSNTAAALYMVFNLKTAHNSGTVEGGNQVTIVSKAAGENIYGESLLVAKLTAQSAPYTGQNGVMVTVNTISTADGTASVTISLCGDETCDPGENCLNCPSDCVAKTNGKPSDRYCCVGDPADINAVQYGEYCV